MKKVLALVLAVMMMATVAFAAGNELSGDALGGDVVNNQGNVLPGGKMKFDDSGLTAEGYTVEKAVNSTNYSIKKIEWSEGKALVESVTFDDANDQLVIKIKQDYTLTTNKDLKGEITLKGKKVGKNAAPADVTLKINATVGYALDDSSVTIDTNGDISFTGPFVKGSLYEVQADGNVKYGTLDFDVDNGDVNIEVRVYDGDKLYLYSNVDADTDILKAYADTDADITFLNFPGAPTFNATATVRFYKEEGSYIYANNDGKLSRITAASAGAAGQTAGSVTWDEDEGCYILKTRTLGSYVFSDKPLNVTTSAAPSTTNPDTGANDVVGVATALAAVALVSAAAISLKK